jgi:hypothetical protein
VEAVPGIKTGKSRTLTYAIQKSVSHIFTAFHDVHLFLKIKLKDVLIFG